MKAFKRILLLIPFLAVSQVASAGKSDDIVTAISSACGQNISKKEAVKYIKKLFLCSPGAKVTAGSCVLTCLKSNAGNVAGK